MKNRTRQLISTALITSVLSILIGGFAVVSTYRSEIAMIDKRLNQVANDIRINPTDAVSIALLSIEQNNLDLYKLHLSQNELNISPSNLRTSQCIEYEDIICFEEYTKSGLNLPSLITLNDNLISKRDYIISLVTTNKNLKTNEFKILIDKLTNQIIKPKYIL